ncbi:hypothetical protein RND71_006783 [Anisodus tanguticus]|uniref:Uncharacterized protein n=1 Tax=Anisodus tanguticus TaxID=243964 RepID=A0AAE1VTG3_9SOLA|nr:hypothetical protein RND71_006783 [Anisodus tanguticus]
MNMLQVMKISEFDRASRGILVGRGRSDEVEEEAYEEIEEEAPKDETEIQVAYSEMSSDIKGPVNHYCMLARIDPVNMIRINE